MFEKFVGLTKELLSAGDTNECALSVLLLEVGKKNSWCCDPIFACCIMLHRLGNTQRY